MRIVEKRSNFKSVIPKLIKDSIDVDFNKLKELKLRFWLVG